MSIQTNKIENTYKVEQVNLAKLISRIKGVSKSQLQIFVLILLTEVVLAALRSILKCNTISFE